MLPKEIYVRGTPSSKFKYSHPLNHEPVDNDSLRARLAYDLMTFMNRPDCHYFMTPESLAEFDPSASDDEIDIMIVDGAYKEAGILVDERLREDPDNEKLLFQKSFIEHLKQEYAHILEEEEKILKSDPENVNALLNKGVALTNLDRETEALDTLDKALHVTPEALSVLSDKTGMAKVLDLDTARNKNLVRMYNVSSKYRQIPLTGKWVQPFDVRSAFKDFNTRSG